MAIKGISTNSSFMMLPERVLNGYLFFMTEVMEYGTKPDGRGMSFHNVIFLKNINKQSNRIVATVTTILLTGQCTYHVDSKVCN